PIGSELSLAQLRTRQWLENVGGRLRTFAASAENGETDWVVEEGRQRAVTFKPVRVSEFAEEYLFSYARRVVMLSATILDADTYLAGLGIDSSEAEIIRVDSHFPVRNRPVVLRPAARLSRHHLEENLPRLAAAVEEIMAEHPDEKGVIHTHSYRINSYLQRHLSARARERLITHHDSSGRDAALFSHLNSPDASVLLTPSMTEGIDLPGDLARWQVLCKVPYPNLGDAQVRGRTDQDPAWYAWRTCLGIVQAYGRSVRSVDDYAVTYLLDAAFPSYLARQRANLPGWFLEAVEEGQY
ncbi:MAG TPA: helicase C-terminal domain-containing protein, partial [Deinococcales bacterium]|nr:helicase C-terminal domain-containing protein [Deinococcales bacterium]